MVFQSNVFANSHFSINDYLRSDSHFENMLQNIVFFHDDFLLNNILEIEYQSPTTRRIILYKDFANARGRLIKSLANDSNIFLDMPIQLKDNTLYFSKMRFLKYENIDNKEIFEPKQIIDLSKYENLDISNLNLVSLSSNEYDEYCYRYMANLMVNNSLVFDKNWLPIFGDDLMDLLKKYYLDFPKLKSILIEYLDELNTDNSLKNDVAFTLDEKETFDILNELKEKDDAVSSWFNYLNSGENIEQTQEVDNLLKDNISIESENENTNFSIQNLSDEWIINSTDEQLLNLNIFGGQYPIEEIKRLKIRSILKVENVKAKYKNQKLKKGKFSKGQHSK